ncbi:MAG: hydantoinase/oxoprolinase family protein [Actinomycetota bacterium]
MRRVGVDIGGTFTDLVLYDTEAKQLTLHKVLTTPANPAEAVLLGVVELLTKADVAAADVEDVTYGTTVATNAVLERKGPLTALLTTEGFRDILLIQRQARYDLFDLFIDKPKPLLERREIHEVRERLDAAGETLVDLDEDGLRELITGLKEQGVSAVAISFLHAYRNGSHERRAAELVRALYPECHVSLSSEVAPMLGEYERTNTTVTDAYVKPLTAEHLRELEDGFAGIGITAPLAVMLSDAGVASVERATAIPVRIIESGPAAGAQIAAFVGASVGADRVIAFDMGGTTAKVALIENGRPRLSDELEVDRLRYIPGSGLPLRIPSVDMIEIGSGGGSIASVEHSRLKVGPESAGAAPGPVSYGGGGTSPTVTDADLVLEYLNPDFFLGGRMQLDIEAAREAIASGVAEPLGLSLLDAARGIYEVINAGMEQAIRAGTVQRGRDPRDYVMVATGGAGPVHAAALARALGVPTVVFPPASGVASALGLLAAEPRASYARSGLTRLGDGFTGEAQRRFKALAAEATQDFAREIGEGRTLRLRRSVSLRYVGQGYDITIDVDGDGGDLVDADAVLEAFHLAYEKLYDRSERGEPVEATTWRLNATVETPVLELAGRGDLSSGDEGHSTRNIWDPALGDGVRAATWRYDALPAGATIDGPAVIEQSESTAVIFTGDRAVVDEAGNIVVSIAGSEQGVQA